MPRIPIVSGREAIRAFERAGWLFVRQRGSHMILNKEGARRPIVIPDRREVPKGILLQEIKKSGLTVGEFVELLSR